MAWINCTVNEGCFPDEVIAGIETNGGRKHLFVQEGKIRQQQNNWQLEVQVLPEKIFNTPNMRRVVLPSKPIEGGAVVEVDESALAVG